MSTKAEIFEKIREKAREFEDSHSRLTVYNLHKVSKGCELKISVGDCLCNIIVGAFWGAFSTGDIKADDIEFILDMESLVCITLVHNYSSVIAIRKDGCYRIIDCVELHFKLEAAYHSHKSFEYRLTVDCREDEITDKMLEYKQGRLALLRNKKEDRLLLEEYSSHFKKVLDKKYVNKKDFEKELWSCECDNPIALVRVLWLLGVKKLAINKAEQELLVVMADEYDCDKTYAVVRLSNKKIDEIDEMRKKVQRNV